MAEDTQDKPSEPRSKHLPMQLVSGAVIGFAASCFFGPGFLGWWYEPPIKDAFSCATSVRAALSQFVVMQLISAALGCVAAVLSVFFVRRALAKRNAQPTKAPG